MKFKRRVRQDIDVNMTPLIDVVFLLLIFFMVSTTFTKDSHLQLQLPKAQLSASSESVGNQLQLVIDAAGLYSIDGKVLEYSGLDNIKAAMQAWLSKHQLSAADAHLTISADAGTAHQFVVSAMDVAGQLGFYKLSIATLQTGKP
ncbi:MAG: biopolymer transporter ExbD [Oceanospirillaceae bacterium]|nr:biopolymer transporter ExbD [Oceanospirillaceae bacterium]